MVLESRGFRSFRSRAKKTTCSARPPVLHADLGKPRATAPQRVYYLARHTISLACFPVCLHLQETRVPWILSVSLISQDTHNFVGLAPVHDESTSARSWCRSAAPCNWQDTRVPTSRLPPCFYTHQYQMPPLPVIAYFLSSRVTALSFFFFARISDHGLLYRDRRQLQLSWRRCAAARQAVLRTHSRLIFPLLRSFPWCFSSQPLSKDDGGGYLPPCLLRHAALPGSATGCRGTPGAIH